MISAIEYNGYTFNTTNADIESVSGIGFPDIRATEQNTSEQDGSIPTSYRFGSRTFGWTGHLTDTTAALYLAERDDLMGALNLQNQPVEGLTMTFTLITGDTRTLRETRLVGAVLDFPDGEPSIIWNSYALTFRSSFGFFEGTETDGDQQITVSSGGTAVPSPVPSPLSGTVTVSSGTDPLTVTNAGNANAYPVFTITGPGTTFTISNLTTGHSLTLDKTLIAGDTVEIDTRTHTIVKNGSDNVYDGFSGSFIYIQSGSNTITFTAASGTDANTQLRTVFSDTYIGI